MDTTTRLFEQIIQKCHDLHWYGPELLQDRPGQKNAQQLCAQFEFPPATEEQLQETEAALGFPLPLTLRMMYQKIANGGFGCEYGLIGAKGGFSVFSLGGTIDEAYRRYPEDIPVGDYTIYQRILSERTCYELPMGMWSDRLLPICDMGCVSTVYIDIRTSQILRGAPTIGNVYMLWLLADSLEEWFEQWIERTLPVTSC
jgi:hypothetical protein